MRGRNGIDARGEPLTDIGDCVSELLAGVNCPDTVGLLASRAGSISLPSLKLSAWRVGGRWAGSVSASSAMWMYTAAVHDAFDRTKRVGTGFLYQHRHGRITLFMMKLMTNARRNVYY